MDFKGENIDRIFREGLKNFEVAPPPEVWEGVMQTSAHEKKRAFPIFRYAAAAVVLLLVVGSLYTIINKPKPGESVAGNSPNEKAIVQKNLQKDTPPLTQSITPNRKDDNKSAEKVVQKNLAAEKPLVAETQIIIKAESEDISSVKVLQTREPVNIRNETNTFLLAENYHPIESKSFSPFVDVKFIILNSKVAYSNKELPVINDFVNEPIDHKIENQGVWSFGAKFSPLYTSRNVTMSMPGNFKEMYDNVEEGIIAFSGGFNFKYKPANRISIHAGLFYSRMGQKITDLVVYDVPPYIASTLPVKGPNKVMINSSFGPVVVPETSLYVEDMTVARVENKYSSDYFDPAKLGLEGFDAEISQSFEYIEIPLLLSYKVVDRVIDFQLLGGVSTNLLIGNNVFAEFDGQRINLGKTDGIYKINYSSVVGFGIEYGFSDQLSLSIEPTFKYYLNSFSSGTRLHVHPFSIGLFSGVSYKF
ncbi:MAG: outer membrane beta-barrel protein [Bacteroidetes bacterium]|nr:outer membrane beta-barrel protein [Bacteroidota bacterium]